MSNSPIEQIKQMDTENRLHAVQIIWDSLLDKPDSIPLTEKQKSILDKRLQSHLENPEQALPWEEVKEKLNLS